MKLFNCCSYCKWLSQGELGVFYNMADFGMQMLRISESLSFDSPSNKWSSALLLFSWLGHGREGKPRKRAAHVPGSEFGRVHLRSLSHEKTKVNKLHCEHRSPELAWAALRSMRMELTLEFCNRSLVPRTRALHPRRARCGAARLQTPASRSSHCRSVLRYVTYLPLL